MTSGHDHDDLDLDALKGAMDAATPRPDPARRAAHLRLAQENFDKLQGSRSGARPSLEGPKTGLWTGVKTMLHVFTTKGALTATTALVAVGFLFLTPAGQGLWQRGMPQGEGDVPVVGELPVVDDVPVVEEQPVADVVVADMPDEAQPDGRDREQVASDPAPEPAPHPMPVPAEVVEAEAAPIDNVTNALGGVVAQDQDLARMAPPSPSTTQRLESTAEGFGAALSEVPMLMVEPSLAMPEPDTEAFANDDPNPVQVTVETPVSTFSIDVDTASYAVVRSSLTSGYLPPPDAVRVEEMINYFPYDYPAPGDGEAPFRPTVTVTGTPWNAGTQLVTIGIQGEMPAIADRPPLNLVFLIDTSGSMADADKLPLLKQSFRLMLDQLRPEDEVAIVEYAGSAGLVLAATPASERQAILQAIGGLGAGGSTNGQGGLEQAYAVAADMAAEGEVSRVLLATDGDFNVGLSGVEALTDFIADKRDTGVYLSVLGFGRGNLDDATMQALAQNGNGTAAYIDTLSEAQKVLVDQLTGALFPIAGDVKVQVEWNPAEIAEYRLIGYETRALRREDFNNDAVDAGELGAGHSVTAIYEVTPVGSPARLTDPLRYAPAEVAAEGNGELGFLRLRWKEPGEGASQLIETPITEGSVAGTDAQFAAAIAGFGQLLRGSDYLGDWGWDEAIALANANRGEDAFGYRTEAVQLMRLAQSLSAR